MALISKPKRKNRGNYTNEDAVEKTIQYVTRTKAGYTDEPAHTYGGFGINSENVDLMCRQFRSVQAIYHKEHYGKRIFHECVSFYPWEIMDENGFNRIDEIAYKFGAIYFLEGFQAVYATHMDTEYPHIHYIVNATNFVDGHKFNYKLPDVGHREEYLNRVIYECLGRVAAIYRIDDMGWTPKYYDELKDYCFHSGFLL